MTEDVRSRIAAHLFLQGLNERQFEILAECGSIVQFETDQMVFHAGDAAKGFYLVENGSVAVEGGEDGKVITIDTVRTGEPLGWSWLFEPYVCEYAARALEPTTTIFIDALRLADHRGGDLTLGHELFKRMSTVMVRRLNAARARLVESARERAN